MPLPEPIGKQREVLYYPPVGHVVVLGTAGSGKTTLAILRAVYLATKAPNRGRTLLATYNKMLVTYLKSLAPELMAEIEPRTYHRFARGYLESRGMMAPDAIAGPDARLALVRQAVYDARAKYPRSKPLQLPERTIGEELAWISRMGLVTNKEYAEAERIGRGGVRIAAEKQRLPKFLHELITLLAGRQT